MFDSRLVRRLSTRRLIMLATVANLGIAAAVVGVSPQSLVVPAFPTAAAAESQRPVGFGEIVEKVKPAVISVRVKVDANAESSSLEGTLPFPPNSPMERFFRRFGTPDLDPEKGQQPNRRSVTGQGSGFFITADGYAVTNNHVVDKAKTVEVITDDGKILSAKVIGTDSRTDLALIKVEGRSDFPHVTFADKAPRIGDWVVAVGNPFGLGGTVTAGIVSARGRDIGSGPYDDFIQIDAPINKGNSGGPTFDMDGNVIGVNTAIFSPSGGGSVCIRFDIPADTVKSVVAQLKDKGMVNRGWIGTQVQPVTADIAESLGMKGTEGAGQPATGEWPGRQGRHPVRGCDHRRERQSIRMPVTLPGRSARWLGRHRETERLAGRGEKHLADTVRCQRTAKPAPLRRIPRLRYRRRARLDLPPLRWPAAARRRGRDQHRSQRTSVSQGLKTGDVILDVARKIRGDAGGCALPSMRPTRMANVRC